MRRMTLVVAALVLLAVSRRVPAQQPATFSPLDLVGTWTLGSAEPGDGAPARGRAEGAPAAGRGEGVPIGRGARGDGAPATGRGGGGGGANLKGLLIFDRAGHAFEMITRASMQQPAGAQPPLTDQQLRFAMSGGFWGSYKVDAQKKTMTFQTEGAFSPNMMGRELTRSFELAGDRLVVRTGAANITRRRERSGRSSGCRRWTTSWADLSEGDWVLAARRGKTSEPDDRRDPLGNPPCAQHHRLHTVRVRRGPLSGAQPAEIRG